MVIVAQLVRAPDCGSGGRGFETHHSPLKTLEFSFKRKFTPNGDCSSVG